MNIFNPATNELIISVKEDDQHSFHIKLANLKEGQKLWAKKDLQERISILQKFASLLQRDLDSSAAILTSEVGKPLQQSKNEVNGACARIDWLTNNAEKYLSEEWMTTEGATLEKIVYEPLGIIGNISAWNYPYLVGTNVFVPALLAGNSVLYKPSELSTLTGINIQQHLYEAGVPENVFQILLVVKMPDNYYWMQIWMDIFLQGLIKQENISMSK